MTENKIGDILRASVESVRSFTEMDTVTGRAITTPSGVTVIPVSKMTVGFATGGVDYGRQRRDSDGFGGGGGTAVSMTPVAFLTIGPGAEVNLIPLNQDGGGIDRVASLVERAPDLIEKIKNIL